MKKLTILLVALFNGLLLNAQAPDYSEQCKTEMKKLDFLIGDWKGTAVAQTRSGPQTINQTEHIEWKLDGVVLAIEGTGRQNDQITFNAMAIVNFDPYTKQFKLKSYTKEGNTADAYFKILQENKFEWGFEVPNGGKVKFLITLDREKKTWNEIGEYSPDGTNWMKTIEMNLTKI